jgi:hypothetical protein
VHSESTRENCEEGSLFRGDLHAADPAKRRGLGDQRTLHIIDGQRVIDEIRVQSLAEKEALGTHGFDTLPWMLRKQVAIMAVAAAPSAPGMVS